ncbi:MAG: helix-turn-helix domain-containing protein [Hyphomonas sp.]|nr:helix-turn-helix domain-containing protein [Hyphomonas sp.]
MLFQIGIDPNRRAATRFIGKVRRALIKLMVDNPEVSRKQVADAIGVHRSVITRQLNGDTDINVGRIAEIAWALGYRPVMDFERIGAAEGGNLQPLVAPAYQNIVIKNRMASGNEVASVTASREKSSTADSETVVL